MTTSTLSSAAERLREKLARAVPGIVDRPALPHSGADADCRRCGGFGWHQSRKYNGHWFTCECVSSGRGNWLSEMRKPDYSRLGLREDELGMDWSLVKPDISDGLKAMQAVRGAYIRGHGMVFLWGTYGQAKTLVGKILSATAYRDGKRGAYANMSAVLDDIRLAFDHPEHKTTELLRRIEWWTSRDVLFLDELDKTNGTEWAQERLFQLLDQRYTRAIREEALTVIASNKPDGALDGYLKSRLSDNRLGPVLHLSGPDGRAAMPEGYRF